MKRYTWAITMLIFYLRVQALLALLGTCLFFLLGLSNSEWQAAIAYLLSGLVTALFSYAFAQFLNIYLLIAKRILITKK